MIVGVVMPKQTLNYGEWRRVTFLENPIAYAAKRFVNTSTGEEISGAKARQLAGSQAPSRQTVAQRAAKSAQPSVVSKIKSALTGSKPTTSSPKVDRKHNPFERAIKDIKQNTPIKTAAKEQGVSEKRLKEYMKAQGVHTEIRSVPRQTVRGLRMQRQTVITVDSRNTSWYTISNGVKTAIEVDSINARKNGYYLNDVRAALKGDTHALDKWQGQMITTTDGVKIPLETNIKALKKADRQTNPNPYSKL